MLTSASYNIIIFCFGALTLAGIYHAVLYYHRRSALLKFYCIYLWTLDIYIAYRTLMASMGKRILPFHITGIDIKVSIDSTLMWMTYLTYVLFWGNALQLNKNEGNLIWRFYKTSIPIILLYILYESVVVNIPFGAFDTVLYILIRVYLGCFGFVVTIYALRRRKNYYFNYLASGSIAIITSSLFSTYVQFTASSRLLDISALGWMMFGYFLDVVFFSAAVGYRLKEESAERVMALQKIIDQQHEIKKLEIEKIQAEYITREEERSRISSELHDELGGGLSTIRLMTEMIKSPEFGLNGTYLDTISFKSRELIQNMNEIVWSLNNSNDDIAGMIVYIRQYAATFLEDANIHLSFYQPQMIQHVEVEGHTRRNIFLVVKEALHNIVKHSGADEVRINIVIDDLFSVSITDNGKGINHAQKETPGNGLRNMQQRADTLKGRLQIIEQEGTTIILSVPCSSLYNKSVS